MKFNKKAGVPIGTIAIIIIVLIAGIGMWWYFTQDTGPDCDRVTRGNGSWMVVDGYDTDSTSDYVGLSLVQPDIDRWNIRYWSGGALKAEAMHEDQVIDHLEMRFGTDDIRYQNGKLIFNCMIDGYCGSYPSWSDCP